MIIVYMSRVAIIGTAGRNGLVNQLSMEKFSKMVLDADQLIRDHIGPRETISLVSGGAAWSDHVAVRLFIYGYDNLFLYLPGKHRGSNIYHQQFKEKTGIDTIAEISLLEKRYPIQVIVRDGFDSYYDRDKHIAENCDYMIAFAFNSKLTPGTQFTWSNCKIDQSKKFIINI
jgi:hypothetical protein